MTLKEHEYLTSILDSKWELKEKLTSFLKDTPTTEESKGNWTGSQRSALWLYFTHRTHALNDGGFDQRKLLKPELSIPWTKEAFHDNIWIPIQKAMYGTTSMRDLKKDQIDPIHATLERELGEKHGLDFIPIPSDPDKENQRLQGMTVDVRNREDYPDPEDHEVRF